MGNTRKSDNTKRAAGMARKAEAADQKAAQQAAREEAEEEERWQKGTKGSNKKDADREKKAEAARKKAERDSLLAAEEASLPSRAEPKKSKAPAKKTRGLDLSQLDDGPSTGSKGAAALNATGIDNALDALSLTSENKTSKVEKHPERRYPAAYAKYEARRLNEMDEDGTGAGLRQNQKKERIRKEFEKSPENPFNQVTARYDASKDELQAIRDQERDKIEKRLGSKS